jgi:2-keto-4-pentenoate hydratase/2-oxohepta-3-ene-1,7-dioic acid hydratase in catechol pathway
MRWVTYIPEMEQEDRVGLVVEDSIYGLSESRLIDLLGDDGEALAAAGDRARTDPLEVLDLAGTRLRAPVPLPPVVRDFASFEGHIRPSWQALGLEFPDDWYQLPVYYFQNPAAVQGPYDDVQIAPGTSRFDYELEICAVVGKGGANLTPEEAEKSIAGYTLFCDWSSRDIQAREKKLFIGAVKSKDTATSVGPVLVTPDELAPFRKGKAFDLRMAAHVNGELYSDGNLSEIYWSFGQMLAYASRGTRLLPGSLCGSGTVGTGCLLELVLTHGPDKYSFLSPGDQVRLEVEHLGAIEARVTEGAAVVNYL